MTGESIAGAAPRLRLAGVGHSFAETTVLTDVDLTVAPGEVVALMGESGSGKTTLGRIVAGFVAPDHGTVELDGDVVVGGRRFVPPERRRVGVVPQEGALFTHLDVAGNVGFGVPRSPERRARIEQCLELVGLAGFADRRPGELSGGQQQRVAVARALAPSPRLVVLDEPYSGLDAGLRTEVGDQVARALRAAGATALLITHDPAEAVRTADRVGVLDAGRLVQVGTPAELHERPTTVRVAQAAGSATFLPAVRAGDHVEGSWGRLPLDAIGHVDDTDRGLLVVRPWQLDVRPDAGGTLTVLDLRPNDAIVALTVRCDGDDGAEMELVIARRADDTVRFAPGTRVALEPVAAAAYLRPSA